jgi:hypothetical protein
MRVVHSVRRGEEGQDAFEFLMQHGARYNEPVAEEDAAAEGGGSSSGGKKAG